jgi:hypothetical protein
MRPKAVRSRSSIGQQDDAGTKSSAIDELEMRASGSALEETPPVSDHDRVHEQPVLVGQPGGNQLPDDADAAADRNLTARLVPQGSNL